MELIYVLVLVLVFSLFDYFGYNISAKKGWVNEKLINPYRVIQTTFQIVLTLIAIFQFDWTVAVGFNLLWWTWNCDLLFYLIGDVIGIYGRGWFRKEVLQNQVSWAWWTPYGLFDLILNGKDKTTNYYRIINGSILLFQAFIGICITVLLILI